MMHCCRSLCNASYETYGATSKTRSGSIQICKYFFKQSNHFLSQWINCSNFIAWYFPRPLAVDTTEVVLNQRWTGEKRPLSLVSGRSSHTLHSAWCNKNKRVEYVSTMEANDLCIYKYMYFLSTSPTANKNKIREAHRKLMILNHPDRGRNLHLYIYNVSKKCKPMQLLKPLCFIGRWITVHRSENKWS